MSLVSTMFSDCATGIRPAISRDAELGVLQDFTPGNPGVTTLFSSLPCSCQSASPRVTNFYAQRNALVSNEVYFAQEVDIQPNELLIVTRGCSGTPLYLNVQGTSDPVSLGSVRVWVVHCEEVDQPK